MKKEEFIKALKFLGIAYNKEFTQEQAEVWYKFFINEDYEIFRKAIKNIIAKQEYLPSIAQLKKEMANLQINVPKAEDEWLKVLDAVHKYGRNRQEEALNSLKSYTAYITRHIGYQNICNATDQTWNKKEFVGEYETLKNIEIENLQIGNKEELKLIGE